MNIRNLQKMLSNITEIKPLGKTAKVNGVICHIIGLVRYEHVLRIVALQYDGAFAERIEADETANPQTNREFLRSDKNMNMTNIFHAVNTISIGEKQFAVGGTETTRCDLQNWEMLVMLIEFLRLGWNPSGIEYQNIESLFLTIAELSGEYDCMPDFGESSVLHLTFRYEPVPYLVEQSVTLAVGTKYPDRLWFQDKNTEEKHWVQINRVYLLDIWEEAMKIFNDPCLTEKFTAAELERNKEEFERGLTAICPKCMCFPVIEYECEEDIALQFHSKTWLDAEPDDSGYCIGFLMKPDEKTGVLGLPLKTAMVQEPMPQDTLIIQSELFSYIKPQKYEDVTM